MSTDGVGQTDIATSDRMLNVVRSQWEAGILRLLGQIRDGLECVDQCKRNLLILDERYCSCP